MKVTVLQHTEYEDAGYVETWLAQQNAQVEHVHLYQSDYRFPQADEFDLLVICGGPMGAYEEDKHPWLKDEKAFIRTAMNAGKKVLGLCLGGQLIASALGAEITKNQQPEIGWFELTASAEDNDVFQFPASFMAMEWHYDTFALPDNATLLASSAACRNQAYQIGKNIIGLQFHPEMTGKEIRYLINTFPQELKNITGIQTHEEIDGGVDKYADSANQLMADILNYLIRD